MITLVEALNYKCLRYVRVPLGEFQILVGPNASGKSAFFDALLFLRDLLSTNAESAVRRRAQTLQELVWQRQDEKFEIAAELAIPEDLRNRNGLKPYAYCRYIVQVGVDEREGIAVTGEQLWLKRSRTDRHTKKSIKSSFPEEPAVPKDGTLLVPLHGRTPEGFRKGAVVQRTPKADYFRSEIGRWSPSHRYSRTQPAIIHVHDEERFPVATWLRKVLSEKIQLLQLNPVVMRAPCPPDVPKIFSPDGSNLPMIVRDLRQREQRKFRWWLSHLQSVLPDLSDIEIEELPHNHFLYLQAHFAGGLTVPQWLLSDGTLRLMALTLLPYVAEQGSVWIIEEPENGIHPTAIEEVFKALSPPNQGQILVATHSPMFLSLIDRSDLHFLLCFARSSSGSTDIVRGDQHPQLRRWEGEVNLSVYFAGGVLA